MLRVLLDPPSPSFSSPSFLGGCDGELPDRAPKLSVSGLCPLTMSGSAQLWLSGFCLARQIATVLQDDVVGAQQRKAPVQVFRTLLCVKLIAIPVEWDTKSAD